MTSRAELSKKKGLTTFEQERVPNYPGSLSVLHTLDPRLGLTYHMADVPEATSRVEVLVNVRP